MKPESVVQDQIRLAAGQLGIMLMRNNTGACEDAKTGRIVRYGLLNDSATLNKKIKSSDLIGLYNGTFLAVEAKREGWKFSPSDARAVAQKRFIDTIRGYSGIAGFAASVEDFNELLERGYNRHG